MVRDNERIANMASMAILLGSPKKVQNFVCLQTGHHAKHSLQIFRVSCIVAFIKFSQIFLALNISKSFFIQVTCRKNDYSHGLLLISMIFLHNLQILHVKASKFPVDNLYSASPKVQCFFWATF